MHIVFSVILFILGVALIVLGISLIRSASNYYCGGDDET